MRSSFASRRPKARKIEADENEEDEDNSLEKPTEAPRPKITKKKKATLRLSFGGPDTEAASSNTADSETPAFVPKKSALSRKAIERNAARKSGLAAGVVGIDQLNATTTERPSYSKEYLEELKSSTPTAPIPGPEEESESGDYDMTMDDDVMAVVEKGNQSQAVVTRYTEVVPAGTTGILDEGLVRVLKARRAEKSTRTKAGDFISLDGDSDDNSNEILLKSKKKKSRLVPLDEDEEMEKYVEDERIVLGGKSAQRRQEIIRRKGIRDAIDEAEGVVSDADSVVSKDSLEEEWERDQIRKGAFSSNGPGSVASDLELLTRQPPHVTPLPSLKDAMKRLQDSLAAMEFRRGQTLKMAESLQAEKNEIAERENMVQERLRVAGEQYEKMRGDLGMGGGAEGVVSRGLESFGNTPMRVEGGNE